MQECNRNNTGARTFRFRIRRFLAAAAAAAGAACTAVSPVGTPLQSNASVTAPAVATGDSWTYSVRDGFTGLERGSQMYQVTESGKDRITVAVSRADGAVEEVHVYDREWNWLRRPATNLQSFDYSPAYQAFAFPLVPGKTWRQRLFATDPADRRRFPVWLDGTVYGWERIKVPAGEFDAIRVRRFVVVNYWEYSTRGHSDIVEEEWYAPAVKQVVRREASSKHMRYIAGRAGPLRLARDNSDGDSPSMVLDDWLIWELVRYSVH
jgi:hypothetical protein